ncbi:MAG: methionine adenosyltransferase [Thermoprotei archaeon]|nr:methionine adenosyltransferase [TACK group archaeon]
MSSGSDELLIEELKQTPLYAQPLEVVERKGIGHPDTICDGVVEEFSHQLAAAYWKKFNDIYHYNVDKAFLRAGRAEQNWGGGKIIKPMLFILGDRATWSAGEETIDVGEIGISSAKKWIRENLNSLHQILDPDSDIVYQVEIEQGSKELSYILNEKMKVKNSTTIKYSEKGEIPKANDTSATVGYAPLTKSERMTYLLERHLNSKAFKQEHPEVGEDIKVMTIRKKNKFDITAAVAFVDRYVKSEDDYFNKKEKLKSEVEEYIKSEFLEGEELEFSLNALDRRGKGLNGVYLTVTGTSAEDADSGEVGRGNRVDGIISLNRPASNEAAAGKNTVSHVGLIYNILSFDMARDIYSQFFEKGLEEVYVWMVSQIGRPVNSPKSVTAQLIMRPGLTAESIREEVKEVIGKRLDAMPAFIDDITNNKTDRYIEKWMAAPELRA